MGELSLSRTVFSLSLSDRMPISGCFIDSSLLLLLVVGRSSREIIAKHRRLRKEYSAEDFDILLGLLERVDQVCVTPHTLTETSNLLAQHGEPERSRLFDQLRHLIHESKEVAVKGTNASNSRAFKRLGITDSALLEVVTEETPLLTVDFDLYQEAVMKGPSAAVNFTRYRKL